MALRQEIVAADGPSSVVPDNGIGYSKWVDLAAYWAGIRIDIETVAIASGSFTVQLQTRTHQGGEPTNLGSATASITATGHTQLVIKTQVDADCYGEVRAKIDTGGTGTGIDLRINLLATP